MFWPLGVVEQCHNETHSLVLVWGLGLRDEWSWPICTTLTLQYHAMAWLQSCDLSFWLEIISWSAYLLQVNLTSQPHQLYRKKGGVIHMVKNLYLNNKLLFHMQTTKKSLGWHVYLLVLDFKLADGVLLAWFLFLESYQQLAISLRLSLSDWPEGIACFL